MIPIAAASGFPGRRLAYRRTPATAAGKGRPGVFWLGGYNSDLASTKAAALDRWAGEHGRACVRFDYFGHGRSEGRFVDGTIGLWLDDAVHALRALTDGPQIVVGSSMGGWLALLLARELTRAGEPDRLAGMVLIAPAVDFTERLMWDRFTPDIRAEIAATGRWLRPTDYGPEPVPVTRALIEDGRRHLLFDGDIRTGCPIHILQGMQDSDVPWQHAMLLVEHLAHDPASITLIRDGDHRLSRDEDIDRLLSAVAGIA